MQSQPPRCQARARATSSTSTSTSPSPRRQPRQHSGCSQGPAGEHLVGLSAHHWPPRRMPPSICGRTSSPMHRQAWPRLVGIQNYGRAKREPSRATRRWIWSQKQGRSLMVHRPCQYHPLPLRDGPSGYLCARRPPPHARIAGTRRRHRRIALAAQGPQQNQLHRYIERWTTQCHCRNRKCSIPLLSPPPLRKGPTPPWL